MSEKESKRRKKWREGGMPHLLSVRFWREYPEEVRTEVRTIFFSEISAKEKIRRFSLIRLREAKKNKRTRTSKLGVKILNVLSRGSHTIPQIAGQICVDAAYTWERNTYGHRVRVIKDSVLFSINRSMRLLELKGLAIDTQEEGFKGAVKWSITDKGRELLERTNSR